MREIWTEGWKEGGGRGEEGGGRGEEGRREGENRESDLGIRICPLHSVQGV